MPYKSFKVNDRWCVYKYDESTRQRMGKSFGCHDTKSEADKQVAALWASEGKMEKLQMLYKAIDGIKVGFEEMLDELEDIMTPDNFEDDLEQDDLEKASTWRVGASRNLPIKKRSGWDGAAAKSRIFSWAGWPDNPSPSKARRGFLLYDSSNAENKGAYKDPIADVVDGKLTVITGALRAAASRLPQTSAPADVIRRAQSVLASYQRKAEKLTKSDNDDEDIDVEFSVDVLEKSAKKQITYSVVYEPDTQDSQGDQMTEEEIEKMAHNYLRNHLVSIRPAADLQHEEELDLEQAVPVETYVAPVDFTINNYEIKKGSWILAMHIPDPTIWEMVEKGEITGYSLRGKGLRVPIGAPD